MTAKANSSVAFPPALAPTLQEIGWLHVELLNEIASTNAFALDAAREGLLVAAHSQTAGRGRLDRTWQVPAGVSVSLSAVMRLPKDQNRWGWVPLFVGLAGLRAVKALAEGLNVSLKWPNDLLVTDDENDPRKLAGILCQVVMSADGPLVVAGIGLNVKQTRDQLPVPTATSLALEGVGVSRDDVIVELARQLKNVSDDWLNPDTFTELTDEVRSACTTIGTNVDVHEPSGRIVRTRAIGLDEQGQLVTQVALGSTTKAYSVADVTHVRRS